VIFYGTGNTGYGLYAVAWDNTAKTFGSTALLVNNTNLNTSETQDNVAAIQTGTNSVLVCYINANANLVAGVVTASGTTLTVGSFSSASTGIDTPTLLVKNCFKNGFGRIFQMGTTYVLPMYITDQIFFYPITISGTTATISARLSIGASLPSGPALSIVSLYVLRMSATRLAFLTNVNDGNGFIGYAGVVNVSGASITQVNVTETQGGYGTSDFTGFGLLSTGRVIFAYRSSSAVLYVAFMNTSGILQQSTSLTGGSNNIPFVGQVVNDKAYYAVNGSGNSYIISDTGSTPVISSALGTGYSVPRIMHYDGTNVYTLAQSSPTIVRAINISGSTPTLTSVITVIVTTTSLTGFGQVRGLSSTEYLNLDYNGTNGAGLIYSTSTNRTYPSSTFCTTAAALVASGATANVVLAIPANLVSDSQWAVMSSLSTSAMFSAGYTPNSTQIQIRRIEIT